MYIFNKISLRKVLLFMLLIVLSTTGYSQGYNHAWLFGYGNWVNKGRIHITNYNLQLTTEQRKMKFDATQGNISDANGNFLMSSNGVWIANSQNDTMLNGSGLNPNSYTSTWFNYGLPLPNGNLILPCPDDTSKYILFHQTGDPNYEYASRTLYYSVIDITGDNGKGMVIQKNTIILQDTIARGIGACKHANGRDWWIVVIKDYSNEIFKYLLSPTGVQYIGKQQFSFPVYFGIVTQPTFSPDGSKFAFTAGQGNGSGYWSHDLRIFDFDRCSGNFYNSIFIDISDGVTGFGVAFSPNSKFLYVCKFNKVLQLNTDTTDIAASLDTVAIYDGFYSPYPPFATDFLLMYLAANGKIYITSGSSVQHIHYIENPDFDGLACDVVQHGLDLIGIWHLQSVPNHPNYYLGCDTTLGCTPCFVSINEIAHDFKFNIYPNPSNGNFSIIYLLPHASTGSATGEGVVEIFDINGKIVFSYNLPQWSTLQQFNLPHLSQGIYAVNIRSGGYSVVKKLIITD